MAHIIVVGAGLGGLPTAYELRHLLGRSHRITLISDKPKFTFIPSLPWVGLGVRSLSEVQMDVGELVQHRQIDWKVGQISHIDPHRQQLILDRRAIDYDFIVLATGASLALDAVPGLGPEGGYTQSVCNPHHAQLACQAWETFLKHPGPLVVGAVPGASCMGPAYEFALLADWILRKKGLRDRVPITFVTPEPYAGHLGIGGMANSGKLVTELLAQKEIELIENAAITNITSDTVCLADDRRLAFNHAMLLPPFRGAQFLRDAPGLTDAKGFVPILPTYQHPDFTSIYSLGVTVQLSPPERTPIPMGVPKTGQMTEAMGMAVAHNIARQLEEIDALPVTPTLEAICMADFGDTGIIFIADPVLPDPVTGKRHRAIAKRGLWVSWIKTAFEAYFMAKLRWGSAVPWFERVALRLLGLSLVKPLPKVASSSKLSAIVNRG